MKSFLEEVVDELRSKRALTESTVIVLPSKRAGTFLKNYIAQSATVTAFAPKIYSIESFVAQIAELSYASNTTLLFELYKSYLHLGGKDQDSFYDFTKWGQVVLQDFIEIDRYLIDPSEIFGYLSAVQEVNHWSVKTEKSDLIKNYMAFWNSLEKLYLHFRESLLEKATGHQGLIYREACARLDTYLKTAEKAQYIFIGFNALNTAENYLIQQILSREKSEIYWDMDKYFVEDPLHDAGYFMRQHLNHWNGLRSEQIKGIGDHFKSKKKIKIIGAPKGVSQAKFVGHLLSASGKRRAEGERTAVVLGDESLLNPLINSIPQEVKSVNITMGYPLFKTPVADLFTQIFELHLQKAKKGWYYKNILALLTNNHLRTLFVHSAQTEAVSKLQQRLIDENWIYLSPEKLRSLELIKEELVDLLFFEDSDQPLRFIDQCNALILHLRSELRSQGNALALEYFYKFYTLFNQLKTLVRAYPFVKDLKSLNALYRELLISETVDFRGEPLQGLQIMGMLESRNLDFETVIITSVNEGILPSGKSNNSFIPYDIKKEFGLPTHKEKDAVYTYHFYRLLQRAKNIFLLYNTESDVLEGGERSRLIAQLLTDPLKSKEITHVIASPEPGIAVEAPQEVRKNQRIISRLEEKAKKGFSPTSLSRYIRNPIDFYMTEVLGIKETQELEESIAANTLGTIVHNSLELLYRPLMGEYLTESALNRLKAEIPRTVEQNFVRSFSKARVRSGKNLIAFEVINRYIENFIDREIEETRKTRIRLLALENEYKIPLQVQGLNSPLFLKGTIDRIDEKEGRLRIIDYKTGNVSQSDMEIVDWSDLIEKHEKSKAFQLLCYALMYSVSSDTSSLEAGVISFKNLRAGFLPFATKEKKGARKKDTEITPYTLDLFKKQLDQLILEICNPALSFVEKIM